MNERDTRHTEAESTWRIPVIEETVEISKREIEGAVYTVTKEVMAEKVRQPVSLSSERVEIERVPRGIAIDAVPETRVEGNVTIVPVVEERVTIVKTLILKEEIRIQRFQETRTENIEAEARKEVVHVDRKASRVPN